jgi:hypothetical protein
MTDAVDRDGAMRAREARPPMARSLLSVKPWPKMRRAAVGGAFPPARTG